MPFPSDVKLEALSKSGRHCCLCLGYKQFALMVGEENIEKLVSRFKSVCPDFEREVVSVVGGRIWSRGGIDLKTRSLCSAIQGGTMDVAKINLESKFAKLQ